MTKAWWVIVIGAWLIPPGLLVLITSFQLKREAATALEISLGRATNAIAPNQRNGWQRSVMENTSPVVMLCRNSLELTKRAVESVLNQDVPVRLYLIDNCSSDGTDSWANEQGKDVLVFRFCPPLGVSAGWNFGLSEAFRRRDHAAMKSAFDSDHAFVINNDVILRSDCLRELLADGGPFVTGVGVDTIEAIGGGFLKSVRPHPDFSCFMIRREVWEKVGLFDERMVLYASDADYHVRMHQAGIHAYTIGMPFYHYASGTLKTASGYEKQRIQEQADRDRAVFERKYGCQIGSPEYSAMFETVKI